MSEVCCPSRVRPGIDALVASDFAALRGCRVGLIVNPTSVDRSMRHLADLVHRAPEVRLGALFGLEHGIRGEAQDMEAVEAFHDPRTGVPVHSLYGADESSLRPRPEQLDGLDALVFDIQDVGSRHYTFAATMLYMMEAASEAGLRFVLLDRPNPIGGMMVEGPSLRPGYESFIGPHVTPIRHGMTLGELSRMFRRERGLNLDLNVVPCEGWSRAMLWDEMGLSWVAPSPNMPTSSTALVYPGGCLLEGTNLSEGRGTTRPFELWGAPWIDPVRLLDALGPIRGVLLRPCSFRPMFHKYAGQSCHGLQPHVVDGGAFQPVRLYASILAHVRNLWPEEFAWRTEPYEFRVEPIPIDLLFGSDRERREIDAMGGLPDAEVRSRLDAMFERWSDDERAFRERRDAYLIERMA